jgi:hypothetical protein
MSKRERDSHTSHTMRWDGGGGELKLSKRTRNIYSIPSPNHEYSIWHNPNFAAVFYPGFELAPFVFSPTRTRFQTAGRAVRFELEGVSMLPSPLAHPADATLVLVVVVVLLPVLMLLLVAVAVPPLPRQWCGRAFG